MRLADAVALRVLEDNGVQRPSVQRSVNLREWNPNVEVVRRPDRATVSTTENLTQKGYRIQTDSDGYILGPMDSIGAKDGPVDILFLGGSTTECLYVDAALRFPYLVSRMVEQRLSGDHIQTLNGGVSGNHSLHSTIQFLAKGVPRRPRFVVLLHNVNDLSQLEKTGSYWVAPESRAIVQSRSLTWGLSLSATMMGIKNALVPNMWELFRSRYGNPARGMFPDEWADFRVDGASVPGVVSDSLQEQFRASLTSFANIAKAWGSEPILMTQFNRLDPEDPFVSQDADAPSPDEAVYAMYARFNQTIREVAMENDVFLIDLAERVPSTAQFMVDHVHLNDAGSQRVAEVISDALINGFPEFFRRP